MLLSQLLEALPENNHNLVHNCHITGIHYDSRQIQADNVFVAIRGHKTDGHHYVENALNNGAKVIIVEALQSVPETIIQIKVKDSRKALACLASCYYHHPSDQLCLIGITGTNGKTTTAYLIEHILKSGGHETGVISTIEYRYKGNVYPNPLTTPESLDLQRIFYEMCQNGITHVVMEVSSHALDLDRVHGCVFDVSVFTNLSQDHLDYHQNMDNYWTCKKRLFVPPLSTQDSCSVINCDNDYGCQLVDQVPGKKLWVGTTDKNNIYCQTPDIDLSGISGTIITPKGNIKLSSPLTGLHNVQNILCAAGVGIALNIELEAIKQGITETVSIPGRLERITEALDRFVFVDYAHTPDALENVIQCINQSKKGRLITLFGCGGDRDRSKRPLMGKVAACLSDLCIVTSDNPRTESPNQIIDDICAGIPKKYQYSIEPDRKKAIQLALMQSQPDDVILIAGKGHETYQILNDKTIEFDDRKHARTYFKSRLNP